MKHDERKNLQDFAVRLGTEVAPSYCLSDNEYEALSSEVRNRRSVVVSDSRLVAGVNPLTPAAAKGFRFERSVLGSIPVDSLLSALGLEHVAAHLIVAHLLPWCSRCKKSISSLPRTTVVSLPAEGIVALVISRSAEMDISLKEWCELLGAERASVGKRIISASDLTDEAEGEPILRVFSSGERDRIMLEIERWFQSGGGEVSLYHAESRLAELVHLQTVSKTIKCDACGAELHSPALPEIAALHDCARCKGQGWLEVDDLRFEACRDCDGYGANDDMTLARSGDFALRHAAAITGAELAALARSSRVSLPEPEMRLLTAVDESPFADYPIGASVGGFSKAERVLLTQLSADLSGLSTLVLLADRATVVEERPYRANRAALLCIEPEWITKMPAQRAQSAEEIRLRDCIRGPLQLKEATFRIGAATAVCGESGAGKSLLLSQLVTRFKKRRKLEQQATFGRISNCIAVDGSGDLTVESVAELLGIDGAIADEFSRVQSAKIAGVTRNDFILSKTARRCTACSGGGYVDSNAVCSECEGVGLSQSVCTVSMGTHDFKELMKMPLSSARDALWMNDLVAEVLGALSSDDVQRLTLCTRATAIPPSQVSFLRLFGALKKAFCEGRTKRTQEVDLRSYLFVLDSVWGLTRLHQQIVFGLVDDAVAAGATIVAAGVPKALEKSFESVVCLRAERRSADERARQRFFDGRFSRVSAISLERS
jgi:hypothetical protein